MPSQPKRRQARGPSDRAHPYRFRRGQAIAGLTPGQVALELERIRLANGGKLETRAIVEAARPKNSLLHRAFEWRDTVAAELYRREQARKIVHCVTVFQEQTGEEQSVYVHVPANAQRVAGEYLRWEQVREDPQKVAKVLVSMKQAVSEAQRNADEAERLLRADDDVDRIEILSLVSQALATASAGINRLSLTH